MGNDPACDCCPCALSRLVERQREDLKAKALDAEKWKRVAEKAIIDMGFEKCRADAFEAKLDTIARVMRM